MSGHPGTVTRVCVLLYTLYTLLDTHAHDSSFTHRHSVDYSSHRQCPPYAHSHVFVTLRSLACLSQPRARASYRARTSSLISTATSSAVVFRQLSHSLTHGVQPAADRLGRAAHMRSDAWQFIAAVISSQSPVICGLRRQSHIVWSTHIRLLDIPCLAANSSTAHPWRLKSLWRRAPSPA